MVRLLGVEPRDHLCLKQAALPICVETLEKMVPLTGVEPATD
jgi:hypothetical protein